MHTTHKFARLLGMTSQLQHKALPYTVLICCATKIGEESAWKCVYLQLHLSADGTVVAKLLTYRWSATRRPNSASLP